MCCPCLLRIRWQSLCPGSPSQAITLAALGAVGAIEIYAMNTNQAPKKDKHGY